MKKEYQVTDYKSLEGFIIKNFIIAILSIGAAEYILLMLLDLAYKPIVSLYFRENISRIGNITAQDMGIIFIGGLLVLVLLGIRAVVPAVAKEFFDDLISRILTVINTATTSVNISEKSTSIIGHYELILLLLICFVSLVLLALPIIVGIYIFSRKTIRQTRVLQEKRDRENEEYQRKRNLMLSDIAHDLRTPMTTVNGYAKALSDHMVSEEKKQEYLETIQIKATRMNDLINLLFDYVKMDSSGFSLDFQKIDLAELLRENAALAYTDIEEAGMEFEINIPEEEYFLKLDKMQFSRVITNLLVNAIRHNQPGSSISLSMSKRPGVVYVDVADNGEAIPDEVKKHLFEPFYRADKSRNNKGGSGLGLSIASKIVEMHGFELSVSEELPGYTKSFRITIRE